MTDEGDPLPPVAYVVAGPPGSGKSTAFPVRETGVDFFNIDDRCAEIIGSYAEIPAAVRGRAQRECEAFITVHIAERRSFAVETTLRTDAAIRQAEEANAQGFVTTMRFIATGDEEENVKRVIARALDGGHSAPPDVLRESYRASLTNLVHAMSVFAHVRVYDNSGEAPQLICLASNGVIRRAAPNLPDWFREALRGSEFETQLKPLADD